MVWDCEGGGIGNSAEHESAWFIPTGLELFFLPCDPSLMNNLAQTWLSKIEQSVGLFRALQLAQPLAKKCQAARTPTEALTPPGASGLDAAGGPCWLVNLPGLPPATSNFSREVFHQLLSIDTRREDRDWSVTSTTSTIFYSRISNQPPPATNDYPRPPTQNPQSHLRTRPRWMTRPELSTARPTSRRRSASGGRGRRYTRCARTAYATPPPPLCATFAQTRSAFEAPCDNGSGNMRQRVTDCDGPVGI